MGKKCHIHTLRGVVLANSDKTLIEDELVGQGWKVINFSIWPNDMDNLPPVSATLRTEISGGSTQYSDAGDNRTIAWGIWTPTASVFNLVDPEHIVVDTLSIKNMSATQSLAYYVELERMEISADETIISLLKERAQN